MRSAPRPDDFIAVNSFGMGARAGEFKAARSDPRGWLLSQISTSKTLMIKDANLSSTTDILSDYLQTAAMRQAARKSTGASLARSKPKRHPARRDMNRTYQTEVQARTRQAILTPVSFAERWVRFWSNHFSVSGRSPLLRGIVGAYAREAIRPNIFGNFKDLLSAAVLHPAMLIYLNNDQSIGPNSRTGVRLGKSYNENLAREVLELHTLGIGSGYAIDDIITFAKALTGWSVSRRAAKPDIFGQAYFNPAAHEPGSKTLMGYKFANSGKDQAPNILNWLAAQPATAKFIAHKLVRHFVSPKAPPDLISQLERSFLETNGDLSALARTLILSDLSWSENKWAYKDPQDFIISVGRAVPDSTLWDDTEIAGDLGQPPFLAPSPKGWPATGESLVTAEYIMRRLSWLRGAISESPNWINAAFIIEEALGGHISGDLRRAAHSQLTRGDALRMVMMSPEFLRR